MTDGAGGWWARQPTGTKVGVIVAAVIVLLLLLYLLLPGERPPAEAPEPPAQGQP